MAQVDGTKVVALTRGDPQKYRREREPRYTLKAVLILRKSDEVVVAGKPKRKLRRTPEKVHAGQCI